MAPFITPLDAFPMVAAMVFDQQARYAKGGCTLPSDEAIRGIKAEFDRLGPFHFAKMYGQLVNNSGEEFACQFMAFINKHVAPGTY